AGGDSPERAHHVLGQLVFAAMEEPEFEVDLAPLPVALWSALGVPPRPALSPARAARARASRALRASRIRSPRLQGMD
ncbi:MAG TPA: hypothetical protein VEY88_17555, partial [Archangium sp.]|nr:hypothetical protein [Archangium sp.]